MMFRLGICLSLIATCAVSHADDWPQWMGARRDNVWRETGIVESLPAQPKVLWREPVAGGYSGPAVANGKVYVTDFVTAEDVKTDNFDRKTSNGTERILCFDEATGKKLWMHDRQESYAISYPAGPRITPLVHGGKVYGQGAEGFLACFDAASGDVIWTKNIKDEYHTKSALWGYASQPLIDGERLILLAGGPGSHCVALHKDTGKEIWRAGTAAEQGYSPPLLIEFGGARQLVLTSPEAVYAVDPIEGKVLWSQTYGADNGSIIMTPIQFGKYLYVGGFKNRNLLMELTTDQPGAKTLWRDQAKRGISPVNVQPMLVDGKIYGFDQNGELRCSDLPSGEILWATPQPLAERRVMSGTAFLVRAGESDKFWMFAETGDLIIGQMSPKGFTELSRMHVIEPTNHAFGRDVVWCAPAFANKHMYVRNDRELICIDLAAGRGQ